MTIMYMDTGLDTGDMLAKTVVPLEPEETGGSLFEKLSEAGQSCWSRHYRDWNAVIFHRKSSQKTVPMRMPG